MPLPREAPSQGAHMDRTELVELLQIDSLRFTIDSLGLFAHYSLVVGKWVFYSLYIEGPYKPNLPKKGSVEELIRIVTMIARDSESSSIRRCYYG